MSPGVPTFFAGLYVLAGVAVHWLKLPEESKRAVAASQSPQEQAKERHDTAARLP